eukprot:TRINITY_DN115228_c0_g1_i1.p1 TRINITY_DN115228_c0_g1~~TRINITY_DN115228_c0_g1_i1.p1  ORF type:complete len:228 (-),score=39.32 TRINITY_DN115228_c0_g1_i1:65-718(-)
MSLADLLSYTTIRTKTSNTFPAIQRGKVLLNMTNAVNALSGLAITPMFMDASYRKVLAASIREARAVFEAESIIPEADEKKDAFLLRWFVTFLLSPQWLFEMTFGRKLKGRGDGFTSMAQDLKAKRVPTEIDFLNGAIVKLGQRYGIPTPVNVRIIALVKEAEQRNSGCPCISGDNLVQLVAVDQHSNGNQSLVGIAAVIAAGIAAATAISGYNSRL